MRKFLLLLLLLLTIRITFAQDKQAVADYIAKYQSLALREMSLYKIPASIILAQGLLESGNGKSALARNANNHFGIKCKTDWTGDKYYYDDDLKHECFRKYKSDTDSYRDHSIFLSTREYYKSLFLLDICDYKGWAYGLKRAYYASEPLYAEMLIGIIEDNQLYNFDCTGQIIVKDTNRIDLVKRNTAKEVHVLDAEKNKQMTIKPKLNNEDDFGEITISGNSRKIYTNNGVRYVKAHKKDNYQAIANDFGLSDEEVMRFNDTKQNSPLKEGEMVYIEAKKKKCDKEYHITAAGETLQNIAQIYGIQVRELYSKNHLKVGSQLQAGEKIWLKNSKPGK
jgi:LysM repeat protein